MQYHDILRDYLRDYAVPAMLQQGWTYKAAKSYGWQKAERGAGYHVDQPLRTHILNGLYALTRVLEYLKIKGYYRVSENDFKRALVLYTLHDAYKDIELSTTRMGNSDFSVPLAALDELIERMGLRKFAYVKAEDVRLASVSLLSPKLADLSSSSPGISHLLTLVHLADAFASQQTARDYITAENRLREITGHDALTVRQDARMSKRLGIPVQPQEINPPLKFYYHELDDYRGLSTLLIHQSTEAVLDQFGLYPILYFANGILYVGPESIEVNVEDLHHKIATTLFTKIRQETQDQSYSVAKEACDPRKGMKIEKYAYLFCTLEHLFEAVKDNTPLSKPAGFVSKSLAKRVEKKKYSHVAEFYERYDIPLKADENETQARQWLAASKIVMAAENIADALVPGDTLEWLFTTFNTPSHVASTIRQYIKALRDGGIADHCIIIAYHWLIQTHFLPDNRTWLEVPPSNIQQAAAKRALQALQKYDEGNRLLAFVEKELGIQSDTLNYLRSNLYFSFDSQRMQEEDPLKEYEKERKQTHKRLCVICSRLITAQVSKKSSEIKTTIAEQQALVFSNKRLPSARLKSEMMVWCPMCYLEFMLRKLSDLSYPAGSDYNASYRLYLYVLPDYSFTPQLWEASCHELLKNFYPKATIVSRLTLRGSKDTPSLPRHWIEQGVIDSEWLGYVRSMFSEQAERMKLPTKDGKPRGKQGDRITFSFKNPNYLLITYDNVVSRSAEKSLAPTHIEVWTKALYAATLIQLLTGARVYITDKPYLSITRPEQMKTIIEMEGLHPLLYSMLPVSRTDLEESEGTQRASETSTRISMAALPVMLDLLAAIWESNAALTPGRPGERRNLDKQVAGILEEMRTNFLAGATLYKMRERDKAPPYPAFTRSCQILLPQQGDSYDETRKIMYTEGYELMLDKEGGDWMNLAERITDTSLKLYFPSAKKEGRAHRFETLFRTGVEAIKINANMSQSEDELVDRVAGTILKRLERIIDNDGYGPTRGIKQVETVKEFAALLVSELFYKKCGGSVSKLTHEENHLSDAIYFLTLEKVNQYWEERRKQTSKKPGEAKVTINLGNEA